MGINSRQSVHPQASAHASTVFRGFEACSIQVIKPNTNTGNQNFDPWTNGTASAPDVIWSGSAQVEVFRQTLTVEVPAGGMTQIRSARFTISNLSLPPIPKGYMVKVLSVDSNRNQDAMNYQYVVTGGIQTPHGFSTTLECEVDMEVLV